MQQIYQELAEAGELLSTEKLAGPDAAKSQAASRPASGSRSARSWMRPLRSGDAAY